LKLLFLLLLLPGFRVEIRDAINSGLKQSKFFHCHLSSFVEIRDAINSGLKRPLTECNTIRLINVKSAHGADARQVRARLAASRDPQILAQTAQHLVTRSLNYLTGKQNPLDFDVMALARSYTERALLLQPDYLYALSARVRLESIESGLRQRNTPPEQLTPSDRMMQLQNKLDDAFWRKKPEEVEFVARELLALAARHETDPEYGNAVFFAHQSLADVALRRKDRKQAARHLLAAADAPPTDRLRYGYIDMTLPRQLVDWGEREAVARFLERCAQFNRANSSGRLGEWAVQIRQGINPDLMPYRSN
jgi:hypothetical protein